jgi:hypothetical protein
MGLRAGGGYLRLRRALGVPAPVQKLRARGARLSGARLSSPVVGTVRQFAHDGAIRLRIGGGGFTLVADAGVFSLAGQDVALLLARRLVAEAGVFSLAGQDAALLLERRLVADAGVFGLEGQDAALLLARRLVAEAGVFSLAGQDVDFVLQTSGGAAFARALHRHAQLACQGSRPAVLAVQVLAAAPKGRISTKGLGGP